VKLFRNIQELRPSVFHVTGLYKQFIYIELFMLFLAKRQNCHVVYDIRAGSMFSHYESRSSIYRFVFRYTLQYADTVMVEGRDYEPFIRDVTGESPYFFPNHVDYSIWGNSDREKNCNSPKLIYLGRIVPEKGIDTVLETSRLLTQRKFDHSLVIVGPGDRNYIDKLKSENSESMIEWLEPIDSTAALGLLQAAHYFIFPTRHTGEGQSNALTESMAAGCVPIVSRNGFNASVIGDAGFLLEIDSGASTYASVVQDSWNSAEWASKSSACSARIHELFSTESVISNLISEYRHRWDRTCRK